MTDTYRNRAAHQQALESLDPELDPTSGATGVVRGAEAIPNLRVRVGPSQQIKVGEDAAVGKPGLYHEGDELDMEGPSAHHLEAMGFVTILGESK